MNEAKGTNGCHLGLIHGEQVVPDSQIQEASKNSAFTWAQNVCICYGLFLDRLCIVLNGGLKCVTEGLLQNLGHSMGQRNLGCAP